MEEKVIKYKKVKEIRVKLSKQGEYYVFIIPKDEVGGLEWGKEYILEIFEEEGGKNEQ
jgi:hypothetical protein